MGLLDRLAGRPAKPKGEEEGGGGAGGAGGPGTTAGAAGAATPRVSEVLRDSGSHDLPGAIPTATRLYDPSDSESYTLNVSGAVDKAHEGKSFKELSKLPPGALQGLKEGKADALLAKLGVKSVGDLAAFKHFRTARAIHVLAKREQDDGRPVGAQSNVNRAVDKAWERKSLREIAAAPPSALQGLTPADDETLRALGVKSVGDLGKWKYALWAEGIAALAQVESADFESR